MHPLRLSIARVTLFLFAIVLVPGLPRIAVGEVLIGKTETWEVFTDGRVGGFLSSWWGDALPPAPPVQRPGGGGMEAITDGSSSISGERVRSGFVGTVFGFGLHRQVTELTRATAYIQIWSFVESDNRRKYRPNPADIRQAYLELEGTWGSLTVGRQRALFSRGATDINYLYGHTYGLGFPGSVDEYGPTNGHIGFGVLANGFAAGFVYATPVLSGFQLTAGIFDPSRLDGLYFDRTKWVRPEAELTFQQPFGSRNKLFLFVNSAWQRLYKAGAGTTADAYGVGYGGRIELGWFHLGVAGHIGKVLGINYAFEWNQAGANDDPDTREPYLRILDGYYVQSQFILSPKWDISLGYGATRVHRNSSDDKLNPKDPGNYHFSLLKQQVGYSGGIVFHPVDFIHLDLDYFRADFQWYGGKPGAAGERQIVNFVNLGATMTW